jgi:Tol biopolymer transport system component
LHLPPRRAGLGRTLRLPVGRRSALAGVAVALALPSAAMPTPPGRNGLIAFVNAPHGLARGIAVIDSVGGSFRQLTRDKRDRSPAWSADGRHVAFARAGGVYVMRADGTHLRRLAPELRGGRQPAWSSSGREVAFTRRGALFVMRSDGSHQRVLYRRRGAVANRPSWSPDGRRIAFGVTSENEHGGSDAGSIVVIGRGGGPVLYVTDGRGEPDGSAGPGEWAEDRGPDWSPDGRRIVFTRRVWLCPRCDEDQIFSAHPDGSDVAWTIHSWSWSPTWSPDGRLLVAVTSEGLKTFTASGTVERKLGRTGFEPAWQPRRR